jgi:hypothetical protein
MFVDAENPGRARSSRPSCANRHVLRHHAIFHIEEIVAGRHILHASCEVIVFGAIKHAAIHRPAARTGSHRPTVQIIPNFGAIRRLGTHDRHGEEKWLFFKLSDRPSAPRTNIFFVNLIRRTGDTAAIANSSGGQLTYYRRPSERGQVLVWRRDRPRPHLGPRSSGRRRSISQ